MTGEQCHKAKRSAWPLAVVQMLAITVYLLSYAPVVRLMGGYRSVRSVNLLGQATTVQAPIDSHDLPIYRPVDWLIDNTPFQDPLLWWAEFCGVDSPFREAMMWRPRNTVTKIRPFPSSAP